jgi:hypothetical protein
MFVIVTVTVISLLTAVTNGQPNTHNQLLKFSPAKFQQNLTFCAISIPYRSVVVRSQAQCIYECQHGGDSSLCVGVNFRQPSNVCDVYNDCPTDYAFNQTGCQFIQVAALLNLQLRFFLIWRTNATGSH